MPLSVIAWQPASCNWVRPPMPAVMNSRPVSVSRQCCKLSAVTLGCVSAILWQVVSSRAGLSSRMRRLREPPGKEGTPVAAGQLCRPSSVRLERPCKLLRAELVSPLQPFKSRAVKAFSEFRAARPESETRRARPRSRAVRPVREASALRSELQVLLGKRSSRSSCRCWVSLSVSFRPMHPERSSCWTLKKLLAQLVGAAPPKG
mmetsp:Transcript_19650/g.54593  ORF Transcript_19650/g.54593 Transcript_19650/m.54593 type:complete len:204 (+) Transcript_19650:583-1194(+)